MNVIKGINKDPYDKLGNMWTSSGDTNIQIQPYSPPRFDVEDVAALEYLEEHGYVVFKEVANSDELANADRIFWEYSNRCYGVSKDKPEAWGNETWRCLGATTTGVISNDASGQSPFMWYVRGLEKIKKAYSLLWHDENLLVSFDGYGLFRPPEIYGQTRGGWFHVDQNGYNKRGRHCVQGFLNMYESGPEDGGLVVVPGSHNRFDGWFEQQLMPKRKNGDFIPFWNMSMTELWGKDAQPIKLCLKPGDFAMWDSRMSHCSHPANMKYSDEDAKKRLRRLVAYVCMTPKNKAKNLKTLREKRIEAVENGYTLNHWPHEYNHHPTDRITTSAKYIPVELNDYQKQLL